MSMMNANAAATTAMTANEPLDFVLPEMGDSDFSSEELAEDRDGFTMSFPRIKIPAGGVLQFELPTGDPQHPDYSPTLTGVILFNHASCAYWPEGDEYNDDEITTDPDAVGEVREALEGKYTIASAEASMIAQTLTELTDPDQIKNMTKLLDVLEDNDDVQNVYHSWDQPDEDE